MIKTNHFMLSKVEADAISLYIYDVLTHDIDLFDEEEIKEMQHEANVLSTCCYYAPASPFIFNLLKSLTDANMEGVLFKYFLDDDKIFKALTDKVNFHNSILM